MQNLGNLMLTIIVIEQEARIVTNIIKYHHKVLSSYSTLSNFSCTL